MVDWTIGDGRFVICEVRKAAGRDQYTAHIDVHVVVYVDGRRYHGGTEKLRVRVWRDPLRRDLEGEGGEG